MGFGVSVVAESSGLASIPDSDRRRAEGRSRPRHARNRLERARRRSEWRI